MQTQSIRCSVVVTAFNYGRYLRRALDSVMAQAFDGFEVIVVDDGSVDDTRAIAAGYGERIRYVHQRHAGPFAAAQTGVRLARGRFVVFVDADDRLRPDALMHLHAAAAAAPEAAIVLGRSCSIDESRGTRVDDPPALLVADPVENFARFCRGALKASVAGGLIDAALLRRFDRAASDYPASMDLAILGHGLSRGCVQAEQVTLDVFAHPDRLREDIDYIHRSGLRLVDLLFDPAVLPAACLAHRRAFLGMVERERTRSYYRAGWHSLCWRSCVRAVAAAPLTSLRHVRNLRRGLVSLVRAAMRADEGPVASPPSHWLFGHQRGFYADPILFTATAIARYRTNIKLNLQRRTYLIIGERDIEQVLRRNPTNYQPAGISRIVPAFAGALLGILHPQHEVVRRWLAPFFSAKGIDAWTPTIGAILGRRLAEFPVDAPFDAAPMVRAASFEVASRIVLGRLSPDEMERLDRQILKSHSYCTRILRSFVRMPRWVPLRSHRVVRRAEREIDAIFADLFSRPRNNQPPALLDQMLAAAKDDSEASRRPIRYTGAGLLLAACEPVAMTTTLALHLLGQDGPLQARLRDEIARTAEGGATLPARPDDFKHLVGLNRFIDEVHRLYPVEWLLTRATVRRERLPSGLLLRPGDQVMIDINSLHRNPARFVDPDCCIPDRFADGDLKTSGAYLPFGAGITACLGQSLARTIITLSLVTALSRWRIESLTPELRLDSHNCFSVAARGPVTLRLHAHALQATA